MLSGDSIVMRLGHSLVLHCRYGSLFKSVQLSSDLRKYSYEQNANGTRALKYFIRLGVN